MITLKSRRRTALLCGMISLACLVFTASLVYAHGHGGGGHGGGQGPGGVGGGHHSAHPHTHYQGGEHGHEGLPYDSHYHHEHDDYGDHYHPCRPISGSNKDSGADRHDPSNEECLNHAGEWEPNGGK
jgi:hypothetical protein